MRSGSKGEGKLLVVREASKTKERSAPQVNPAARTGVWVASN